MAFLCNNIGYLVYLMDGMCALVHQGRSTYVDMMKGLDSLTSWTNSGKKLKMAVSVVFGSMLLLSSFTFAQDGEDEDVFVLSPFEVDTTEDSGWSSANSTSGTSLNTAIKDIPISIEVINSDFLEDMQAETFDEALEYSSGVVFNTLASDYSGIYSGTFGGASIGNFFGRVDDSNLLTVWGYDETWDEGFESKLSVGIDGSFSGKVGDTFVNGSFSGNSVSGSGDGEYGAITFSGSTVAGSGDTSALYGHYEGSANTTVGLLTMTISISADGQIWVYVKGSLYENGGTGIISSNGEFTISDSEGFTFSGSLDLSDYTIAGSISALGEGQVGTYSLDRVGAAPIEVVSEFSNISTHGRVGSENAVMIGGFYIDGSENMDVLIQGVGEELIGLPNLKVSNTLANPMIMLVDASGEVVGTSDDWESDDKAAKSQAMVDTGSFTLGEGSKSSALLETLSPGQYSVLLLGVEGAEGVALVEAYKLPGSSSSELINISTRAEVGAGDNIVIGGFVIDGDESKTVLIQGVGAELIGAPGLDASNVLADPVIALYGSEGLIDSNDDWTDGDDAALKALTMSDVGAYSMGTSSLSSSLLVDLAPGAYTVFLYGSDESSEIALIEVYEVD